MARSESSADELAASPSGSRTLAKTAKKQTAAAPATKAKNKGKAKAKSDHDDEVIALDTDDEETEEPPARARSSATNGASKRGGKTAARGTKALTKNKNRMRPNMDIDAMSVDDILGSDDNEPRPTIPRNSVKGKDVEQRLRSRLEESEKRISDLSKQLEEVFRVRESEPEALLKALKDEYEGRLKGKDDYIKELNSALATKEPLMKNVKNAAVLQLLTRDAADEEKRLLENEIATLKTALADKDQLLKDMQQQVKDLDYELKAEIDRSKGLMAKGSRAPGSAQKARGNILGNDEPKQTTVHKFYEDVTNIIVPNVKHQEPRYPGLDEWVLNCVYVHETETTNRSLNFRLTMTYEPSEDDESTETDQLIKTVKYEPQELNNEEKAFVNALGYMGSVFTFERSQLPLFLKSLREKVEEAAKPPEDNEQEGEDDNEDDEVEMVEG